MPTEPPPSYASAGPIRRFLTRIAWTLTLGVCAGLSAGLWGGSWWILELLTHFQIQYAIATAGLLVCFTILRSRAGMVASGLGLVITLALLIPHYTGGQTPPASSGPALRLVYANVNTRNRDHQSMLDLIRRESPDVIALAEVHEGWANSLASLHEQYPHQVVCPRDDNFGIGLWCRHPLEIGEIRYWGKANVPSIEARFRHQDQAITLLLTHPLPPMRKRHTAMRDEQLRILAGIAKARGPRTILIGDFNTTPFATIFSQVLTTGDLRDSSRGFGPQPTWPARLPWICRIPIDHCLHSADLTVTRLQTGPHIGSDHLPLILELR